MKFARANKLDRKSGGTWGTRPLLLLVKPCYDTDSLGTEAGKFESRADSLPANRPAANETPCAPPGLLAQEEYSLKQDSPRGQGAVKEHHAGQKALLSRDRSFRAAVAAPDISARFPVVGIGASAGGLEAATIFFKELSPHLGMAYVLVLHLDPARESKVTEILARTTAHAGCAGKRRHARGAGSRLRHSPKLRNDHRPLGAAPARPGAAQSPRIRPSILSCDRWLSLTEATPLALFFPEPLPTAPSDWRQSKAKRALPSPRNQPPPSTMACRRAPSPLAVSTSS